MRPITVWLNKNIASTFNLVEILRAADTDGQFRIVCSHPNPYLPLRTVCHEFIAEPGGLAEPAYVEYCLDFIKKHKVNVFLPGRGIRPIVAARQRFEELGVKLVAAADAPTLRLLGNKARLYADLPPGVTRVPDFHVVNTLKEFDAARRKLKKAGHTACFKPCVGVYGLGFKIVTPHGKALDRMLNGSTLKIDVREARHLFGSRRRFRELMVMEYLPGRERSVDCLAVDGELVCCVVRKKSISTEGLQTLEKNAGLVEVVRALTAHFRLNAMFNIQFKEDDKERLCLLEINPRMSGGLHYSCLSGVAFPYWAIRLALGTATPRDVPKPKLGFQAAQVNRVFVLPR
jgi:hypothetical protein